MEERRNEYFFFDGYGADNGGVGVIVGPILGGLLSDPVNSYPRVFGENSLFGGENGVFWLKHVGHFSDLSPPPPPQSPLLLPTTPTSLFIAQTCVHNEKC